MATTQLNDIHSHTLCPCESGKPFGVCCQPYLIGNTLPPTAETLMRSRYTAYTIGAMDYLLSSWHPSSRPMHLEAAQLPMRWLGLTIRHISAGGEQDSHGSVEFIARCKYQGKAQRMHEISQFIRENGQWFYVDGKQMS